MTFAYYRFPNERVYTAIRQFDDNVERLSSFEDLNGKEGFVMAPFRISESTPLLLIRPDTIVRKPVQCDVDFEESAFFGNDVRNEHEMYGRVFALFHEKLVDGSFSKIVLSRCACEEAACRLYPYKLFMRACVLYPRMFVALVSTPVSGTWLMSTPETLLEKTGEGWHTMALAGTMSLGSDDTDTALEARKLKADISEWSRKNIMEQRYVAKYIEECLEHYALNLRISAPYSRRAGFVKHLSTDFLFDLKEGEGIGNLIGELHPTPAVCGIPKQAAFDFITRNESYERAYYSGFAGPLSCGGMTRLYVTLRCMSIMGRKVELYAGGGLLKDSEKQNEWLETEAKMETMRKCLAIKRI